MIWIVICKVFGIIKVQYVMVSQNVFIEMHIMWSYHMYYYLFESFSHIIHFHFIPWPMINNPTSCDRIMYSTFNVFSPWNQVSNNQPSSHILVKLPQKKIQIRANTLAWVQRTLLNHGTQGIHYCLGYSPNLGTWHASLKGQGGLPTIA